MKVSKRCYMTKDYHVGSDHGFSVYDLEAEDLGTPIAVFAVRKHAIWFRDEMNATATPTKRRKGAPAP